MVADYGTKKLIDAEKAIWVVGGSVQGVMTRNAKWAFENKAMPRRSSSRTGAGLRPLTMPLSLPMKRCIRMHMRCGAVAA